MIKKFLLLLLSCFIFSGYTFQTIEPSDILSASQQKLKDNVNALIAGTGDTAGTGLDTWQVGDSGDTNKTITAGNDDSNKPFIRYVATEDSWSVSNNGLLLHKIGSGILDDNDSDTKIQTEETADEDVIRMDTAGTERWIMTASGQRTMPTQATFSVTNVGVQSDFATGSAVTIVLDSETFDIGSNFASNQFTAPVTGKYQLNAFVSLASIDTAATQYQVAISTSNRVYNIDLDPRQFVADILGNHTITVSVSADMNASDTAKITIQQTAGTQQTDIPATGARLSGFLAT